MNSGEFVASGFGFSDKKSGTLMLICELMDMNIYELIRGKFLVHNCVNISLDDHDNVPAHFLNIYNYVVFIIPSVSIFTLCNCVTLTHHVTVHINLCHH